jgi:hypothetical protein
MKGTTPARLLARLERIHRTFGVRSGSEKRGLVKRLRRVRLDSAARILRFHEILCFLRAYPDDAPLLAEVERALAGFERRADLALFHDALADSGIAGTPIRYRFFWPMARWLASRWAGRLHFDREEADEYEPRLRTALLAVSPSVEAEAVKRSEAQTFEMLDRLRGRATDAAWFLRRIESLPGGPFVWEAIHDAVDAAYVLEPGRGRPSRTLARHEGAPIVFRAAPLDRSRPVLAREIARPPAEVRAASRAEGERLVDLAREAMVTRSRDLDAFTWGNPKDVVLVDDGGGLSFAMIGILPERRLPLPAVHGWLTLRNGVPIGYVQSDTLLGSTEIAFNTFETFRGGEAAQVFGRVLAVARHVLGARSFSIEPYQLGKGNAEGIASGAWWFYFKLGFRPKDAAVKRVLRGELARMKRRPAYRSGPATLERLAAAHLYWEPDPGVPGLLPLVPALGLRIAPAAEDAVERAAERLGLRSFRGFTPAERTAWERLAPVVLALPGVARWPARDRRAFVDVVSAKGAPREAEFPRRLDRHARGAKALASLLREGS